MRSCCECGAAFEPTGKGYRCPPCRLTYDRAWRAERKAAGLPTSGTRMPREYHRAYEREYFRDEANRARRNALMRGYAKAHGTRAHHAARRKVRSAIVAGKLKRQPCEVCGASRVHAHHDDYSKPLAVRWLCHPHHVAHHAKAEGR